MFIAFFDPTVLPKDLSDEFLYNIFKFLPLEDKLNFRLVSQHWKKIINWQLKQIITIASYPVYRLYEKCDELYLTSFPLSSSSSSDNNNRNQDQIVNWDRYRNEDQLSSSTSNNYNIQLSIPYSLQEIFEHGDLETIHVGPGVSGLSKEILRKIFASTSTKLRELSWVIEVSEQEGGRNLNNGLESKSIFDGISFSNITDLSLKLIVQRSALDPNSASHHENTAIFIQLLQKEFPMLHYLAVHLSSEPMSPCPNPSPTKKMDRHCTNTNKSTWSVYIETFKFISNHSRTLRVLGLDYYNLNLNPPLTEVQKNPDQWLWAMHANDVKAIGVKFGNLKLQILNLYCAKKEGSLPWILGANLLSSQSHLTELVLKARETSLQSSLEDTLKKNNKTLRYLRLTMTGFSVDFNFNLIRKHKLLRGIELSCFRSLQNPQDIPVNVVKLKLKSNFSATSDLSRILNKCCKLRKLTLQHGGTFWKPVTVDTIKRCLENSTSLAKLCMYNFHEDSIEEYCESRDDLRFSIGGKHKGCIKISYRTSELEH